MDPCLAQASRPIGDISWNDPLAAGNASGSEVINSSLFSSLPPPPRPISWSIPTPKKMYVELEHACKQIAEAAERRKREEEDLVAAEEWEIEELQQKMAAAVKAHRVAQKAKEEAKRKAAEEEEARRKAEEARRKAEVALKRRRMLGGTMFPCPRQFWRGRLNRSLWQPGKPKVSAAVDFHGG